MYVSLNWLHFDHFIAKTSILVARFWCYASKKIFVPDYCFEVALCFDES